jgi:hypothetical protein
MRTDFEDLLLKRALEIRNSWNDRERLKGLIDAWDKEFSHKYDDVVEKVVGQWLEEEWARKAKEHGSNSLEDLLSILLDWPEAEYTKEKIENGYKVTTTLCPIAASYWSVNRTDYGNVFHCISDPYILKGFNNRFKHRKISSCMAGDEACVHFYTKDE